MNFMVEELHGNWREIASAQAEGDGDAVASVCHDAGLYRVRRVDTLTWHYFFLSVEGALEPMDA